MDASYQVMVHLANRFQGRTFLEIGQPEIRIAYGGFGFKGSVQMSNLYRYLLSSFGSFSGVRVKN